MIQKLDLQSVLNVFLDNVSLSVQGQDFKSGTKGVEQNSKEQCSTSRSERIGGSRHVVEDRTEDEGHCRITEELEEC